MKLQILEWWQLCLLAIGQLCTFAFKLSSSTGALLKFLWVSLLCQAFVKNRHSLLAGSSCCIVRKSLVPWFVICDRIQCSFLFVNSQLLHTMFIIPNACEVHPILCMSFSLLLPLHSLALVTTDRLIVCSTVVKVKLLQNTGRRITFYSDTNLWQNIHECFKPVKIEDNN